MTLDAVLAFLHTLAMLTTGATLYAEWVLLRWQLPIQQPGRIASIDVVYFLAAMLTLATGLSRVFLGAKSGAFYADQPLFWCKMLLFMLIGLISIAPTRYFMRWRSGTLKPTEADVTRVYRWVTAELLLFLLLPLFAAGMARRLG